MKTLKLFRSFLSCFELMSRFAQGIIEISLMVDSMDEFVAQVCNLIAEFRMVRRHGIASRHLGRSEGCTGIWEGTEGSIGLWTR